MLIAYCDLGDGNLRFPRIVRLQLQAVDSNLTHQQHGIATSTRMLGDF